jgi:primosomal replication protein N
VNQLRLTATLAERTRCAIRRPGPVVNCILQHAGEVLEAETPRQVEFAIVAMGIGAIGQQPSGCRSALLDCEGFLARKHRNSKTLVFHITRCKAFEKD